MAASANAAAAKARAMYGRRLTEDQYDELMHLHSLQEVAAYLKERTAYGQVLAELPESTARREVMEGLLRRDAFYRYARLARFAGKDAPFFRWPLAEIASGVILGVLRELMAPTGIDPVASLPVFAREYLGFDLFALARAQTFEEIHAALVQTPYAAVLEECRATHLNLDPPARYAAYEAALGAYCYHEMLERAHAAARGAALRQLEDIILMRAELLNVGALYRIKAYSRLDAIQTRRRMLPYRFKIKPKLFAQMVEAPDLEALDRLLAQTPYGSLRGGAGPVEDRAERLCLQKEHRLMRFAQDPKVVYTAFMLLHGAEVENLTRIIEGVRYGLAPERIKSLLC